jgi:hypothetical protein
MGPGSVPETAWCQEIRHHICRYRVWHRKLVTLRLLARTENKWRVFMACYSRRLWIFLLVHIRAVGLSAAVAGESPFLVIHDAAYPKAPNLRWTPGLGDNARSLHRQIDSSLEGLPRQESRRP